MTRNIHIGMADAVVGAVLCLFLVASPLFVQATLAQDSSNKFTHLHDIDTTIVQDIRYYGRYNFLGRKVKGYQARTCILTRAAAIALHNVQDRLLQRNLSLVVYDCYRPMRAIDDITAWARASDDRRMKAEFFPTLKKNELFGRQVLARHLSHTRGSSVDVAIVPLPILPIRPFRSADGLKACHWLYGKRRQDNALDFATSFDCFHETSQTNSRGIGEGAKANRQLLLEAMTQEGFVNDPSAWWHFTLRKQPYPKTSFDFPISNSKGSLGQQSLKRVMRGVVGPVRPIAGRHNPKPPKPKPAPRSSTFGPFR